MGIGPTQIGTVLGVYKAYNTRVGNGPMPTELHDDTGRLLREGGPRPEYGSTTGRPRRCGWFDAVAARYSARINGLSSAALTRLDVLDPLPVINVCTAYRVYGETIATMPASSAAMAAGYRGRASLRRPSGRGPILCSLHRGCAGRTDLPRVGRAGA